MYDFKLPDVGEGIHEAELLEWDVEVGDTVAEGDAVAQVSTDKVNVELSSPCSGVVSELLWSPGDVIEVGQLFMRFDDGQGSQEEDTATSDASGTAESEPEEQSEVRTPATNTQGRKLKIGPAVRRYAAEQKVDLSKISPTDGSVQLTKEDVDRYLSGDSESGAVTPAPSGNVKRVKLLGPALVAAKNLETSARTLATTAMSFELHADAVLQAQAALQEEASARDIKVTPLAVVARCVCDVLKECPKFNAIVDEGERALDVHDTIDLGTAVATDSGLVVPVVRDAGSKGPIELAMSIAETADKARSGSLEVADFRGSTFTLSSTGGLERATFTGTAPVINFPNVALLWLSRICDRPRVVNGSLEVGPVMAGTLSFDHRFLHGADGTAFINTLAEAVNGAATQL